jgi:hypothetical protein
MGTDVHHVVRRELPEDATDDELENLCHSHHAIRTARGE